MKSTARGYEGNLVAFQREDVGGIGECITGALADGGKWRRFECWEGMRGLTQWQGLRRNDALHFTALTVPPTSYTCVFSVDAYMFYHTLMRPIQVF